ncbi:Agrin [Apostichopus japonicus]|uniref:Agrin n=1 Tax=Stichopus japonicus TaxID=307972 RepID=A0A2G8LEY5_STIJA|nr:Agrin [Apostichopus japonicus]
MCKYSFKECLIRNRHTLRTKVCGTDGMKYRNVCFLKRQSCLTSAREIAVDISDSCLVTTKKGRMKPRIVSSAVSHDSHRQWCRRLENKGCRRSMEKGPVCATDDRTYRNECAFWQVACRSQEYISIVHKGVCGQDHAPSPMTTVSPILPAMCLSTCKPGYAFVCGTDGTTYMSDCHLKKLACRADIVISIRHRGVCQPYFIEGCWGYRHGVGPNRKTEFHSYSFHTVRFTILSPLHPLPPDISFLSLSGSLLATEEDSIVALLMVPLPFCPNYY